jgi:hypothetical protein
VVEPEADREPYWGLDNYPKRFWWLDEAILGHRHFGMIDHPVQSLEMTLTTNDPLMRLIPAHLEAHPLDWSDFESIEKFNWIEEVAERRVAYRRLRDSFLNHFRKEPSVPGRDTRWERFVSFAQSSQWYLLLIQGPPPGVTLPAPLLRYEQFNLIVESARREGVDSDVPWPQPRFLWTRET